MVSMSLRKEILEKVPSGEKDSPSCRALLDHIKEHGIKTSEHLHNFLAQEIALAEKWLGENKQSGKTAAKTLRHKTVELQVLKKCRELARKVL